MITRELIIFLYFILTGAVSGVLLDIIRAIRRNHNTSNIAVYLEDFLYWLLIGGEVIWVSYTFDTGNIRMYMIFGVFLGMFLYFLTLTKIICKVLDFTCRYSLRVFSWIFKKFKGATNEKENQLA